MTYKGKRMLMYARYFPKDSISDSISGHRCDREEIVLFLDKKYKINSAAASRQGDYRTGDPSMIGKPSQVRLFREDLLFDYEPWVTSEPEIANSAETDIDPPLIRWREMSGATRGRLKITN